MNYDSIDDFQSFEDYLDKNQSSDLFCRLINESISQRIRYDDMIIDNVIPLIYLHSLNQYFHKDFKGYLDIRL